MKYRLAIIGSRGYPYIYSGYETLVRELAERLTRKGVEVTVYCHRNLFPVRPREVNGIRLVYIPTVERKTLSQFISSFQSLLHAVLRPYDLIFVVNSANGPLGLLPRIFGKRTVINVDGLEWLRPKWKGLGAPYFHWASRWATKLYDAVITDSAEMQKIYKREFNCPSTVIAYGAEIRRLRKPDGVCRWGLEPGQYYLVVGRLVPDNNSDLIIREFIKTQSRRKLVIVGDVPYKDGYASRLKAIQDPRLLFTGYVRSSRELAELYQGCYAYLHGHEFGGTNPALLTALGCGCAVCALDTVFSREVLGDGRYGLLFTKDSRGLKAMIETMDRGPRRLAVLRRRAPERIRTDYTWDKVTDQYQVLFRRTILGEARWNAITALTST